MDLFWAQATIGAELARRATIRITDDQIGELEELHRQYEVAIAEDGKPQIDKLGHVLHRISNLAAASPRLELMLGSFTKQLPNRFYAQIKGQLRRAAKYRWP